jgi:hypothetical protein
MAAAVNSPAYLVNRALARRRVIANNPTVLPAASASQPSPDQLYNFSQVGGLAEPNPNTPTQRPVSPLGQDIPGSSGQGIPPVQTMGGLDLPAPDSTPAPSRPRVVPNQPVRDITPYPGTPSTPPFIEPPGGTPASSMSPIEQELSQLLAKQQQLENTPVEDDDSKLGNFWHGSQYAIRQLQREGGGDVGATIGAMIGGGLRNLFNPKEDDQRKKDEAISVNQKQIDTTQKQYDKELEIQAKKLANRGKEITNDQEFLKTVTEHPIWQVAMKQKQITPDMAKTLNQTFNVNIPVGDWREVQDKDRNGQVLSRKEFETNYTPNESVPVDPTKVPIQTTSPVTGTQVSVEPNQLLSNETTIAQGNAQRQQSADTTNVNNAKEVAIKNAELLNGWQNKNFQVRMEAAKALGDTFANNGEVQGINKQAQTLLSQLQAKQDELAAADEDDRPKVQKQLDDLQEKFGQVQAKFDAAVGKFNGGQAVLNQIQQTAVPKPQLLSAPSKVSAHTVGGKYAGQLFANPDSLKTYFPGKSTKEIRQIVEGQGGKFQQ